MATTVGDLFEKQATLAPDATALWYRDTVVSYELLNRRTHAIAEYLRLECVAGTRVAIRMKRGVTLVEALIGVVKSGLTYVPVPLGFTGSRVAKILEQSSPCLVLTDGSAEALSELPPCRHVSVDDVVPVWMRRLEESQRSPPTITASAFCLLYTSGTTGQPKGVVVGTDAIMAHLCGMLDAYPRHGEELALVHRSYALTGSVWEYFGYLISGIPCVVAEESQTSDAEALLDLVAKHGVSRMAASPQLLDVLATQTINHGMPCETLRVVITGGESLLPRIAERVMSAFPNCTLVNVYGATECLYITQHSSTRGAKQEMLPIGLPFPNVGLYILSHNLDRQVHGALGEVYVGGDCLAFGYEPGCRETASRFVPDVLGGKPGRRMFRTGDCGMSASDGSMRLTGRSDRRAKIRGNWVSLNEVELALSGLPNIEKAVVVDEMSTSGEVRLAAYVVLDGHSASLQTIRSALREKLSLLAVPGKFVELSTMPLTASGKVDRQLLRSKGKSLLAIPAERLSIAIVEYAFATMWSEVLGSANVRIDENFFDLGGDSLQGLYLVSGVGKMLGVSISLAILLDAPTIRAAAVKVVADHVKATSRQENRLTS